MPGNVSISESRAAPVIPPDVDFGMVVIGPTTRSPLPAGQVSPLYSSASVLADDYGIGDAVDAATQAISVTDGNTAPPPVAIYRTPATVPGAMAAIDVTGVLGTAIVSNTAGAQPKGTYEVVGRVADDGNGGAGAEIGQAGIVLEFSVSGGRQFMPTTALGTAFSKAVIFPSGDDTGASFDFTAPAAQVTLFIAAAVEARANCLAHLADAVVHNAADTSPEQVALAASSPPVTAAQAWAVMNLVRAAYEAHRVNFSTVHNSPDGVNVIAAPAATSTETGIRLYPSMRSAFNAHLGIALAASSAGLHAAFASSASPVVLTDADLIPAGVALLNTYPRLLTFLTGGGTPADVPNTVDITGFDYLTAAQSELALALSQIAGTATSADAWRGTGLNLSFPAGQGVGGTLAIGYGKGVHNAPDAGNVLVATSPTNGTLKTGDTWSSLTSPPSWGIADLFVATDPPTGAFAAIAANGQEFGRLVISEPVSSSSFSTLVAGLNWGLAKGKRWRLTVRFRDPLVGETDAAYVLAFQAFATANHDNRITCVVGSGRLTDTFRGYVYQRSGLPAVLARWQSNAVVPGRLGERLAQHPGYVARGPLENFSLVDENQNLIGHDEEQRGGVDGPIAGFGGGLTFYRIPNADLSGTYISEAPVMYPALSEIITEMDRAVANGIERVAVAEAWLAIKGADIWDPVTFALDESIRNALQTKIAKRIRDRYSREFQNPDDPNLVAINPTAIVNAEKVTITGTINVRFYGYDHAIELTFSATR